MITQVGKNSAWTEFKSNQNKIEGSLILHTGANTATLDEVLLAPVPEATDSWKPIGHGVLVEEVVNAMAGFGLATKDTAFSLTRDGARFFGLMEVAGLAKPDYGLVIGLRNSVDKSFPASICTGMKVFVCDNLSFYAEVMINRRHTTHIMRDLAQCVARAIGQIGALAERQEKRFDAYRSRMLTQAELHDIIFQSVAARCLPQTKMWNVRQEFEKPSHAEHAAYGNSVWKLQNAYTEVLKGSLNELTRRSLALSGLLDALCGVDFGTSDKIEFDAPAADQE